MDASTLNSELGFGEEVCLTPYGPGNGLPLFIQPLKPELANDSAAAAAWVAANRQSLDSVLLKVGAFVLRGFAVPDTNAFRNMIASYENDGLDYVGGVSPRNSVDGEVLESTHAPPSTIIPIHQEMSYLPKHPNKVAFFCRLPSVTGGETLLADMRVYTRGIPDEFAQILREKGALYRRNLRAPGNSTGHPELDILHRTWVDTFLTDDKAEAVRRAEAMGMDCEWLPDGSLSISNAMPGFIKHPATGEELSFHQIPGQSMVEENIGPYRHELYRRFYGNARPWPKHTTYGDGSEVKREHLVAMIELAKDIQIKFPWSLGDVLILDNYIVGHGRNSFTGARGIQVSLLK